MAWVDAADMMYLTGLEQYSHSVFLHIAYANFLSTYKKSAGVRIFELNHLKCWYALHQGSLPLTNVTSTVHDFLANK